MNPAFSTLPAVLLQPLAYAHIPLIIDAENHADNRRFVGQWTTGQYRDALDDPTYQCFVFVVADQPVGHCILHGLENPDHAILLKRIIIWKKGWGYGRAALLQIMAYTFDVLKANRLWLDVRAFNSRAQTLYRSVGFRHEGTQRRASLMDGDYYDLELYGMLRDEHRYKQKNRPD